MKVMPSGESSAKLAEMIKKAIHDCELTTTEYNQILALAHQDGVVDAQERNLLRELQELVNNGTIKRVRG